MGGEEVVWFTHGGGDHIYGGHALYGIKRDGNPSLIDGNPLGDTKLLNDRHCTVLVDVLQSSGVVHLVIQNCLDDCHRTVCVG